MNKKINFLCVLVLLVFATIFTATIHAQDRLRLQRPTENTEQITNSTPYLPNGNELSYPDADSSAVHINLPSSNLENPNRIQGSIQQNEPGIGLTQVQLQKLASHDIVLLIDKSGSMATPDCPLNKDAGLKTILPNLLLGGSFHDTRWQWCSEQIIQMSQATQQVLPQGFTVLLFDSAYYLFPHVNVDNLARIFAHNNPGGSTNLTQPLNSVFNDYFKRQKISGGRIKPLLVGIITDGCPDEPGTVRKMLVNLTHTVHDPKEITLVFFLIGGHDSQGEHFVRDLINLTNFGAPFNIVKGVPFSEVQKAGLARSLADNLD